MKRSTRLVTATLTSVMAGVLALLPGVQASTAQAATGAMHSYLVNARTPGQTGAAASAAVRAGGQVVQSWPQIGVVVVRSNRTGYVRTLQRIGSASVLSASDARMGGAGERVVTGHPVSVPSAVRRIHTMKAAGAVPAADPMTRRQGYLGLDRAQAANRITTGSRDVVVGVLDTGVDNSSRDLAGNFSAADSVDCTQGGRPNTARNAWRGADSHGTHVAGTIAAARNGFGVTGLAPTAKVAGIKVVNAAGESYPEFMVCGYMWAAQRQLAVTNASLNVFDLWCGELQLQAPALLAVTRAVNYASGRGVMNVSSAGNDGIDIAWQKKEACHDPIAENPTVVHVSSVDAKGHLSSFSSYGKGMVSIAAPGENVLSDSTHNGFELRTGTSQAAPQVAATLALMRSVKPAASSKSLVATLLRTAKAVPVKAVGARCSGSPKANSCTGAGQLDTLAAVSAAR